MICRLGIFKSDPGRKSYTPSDKSPSPPRRRTSTRVPTAAFSAMSEHPPPHPPRPHHQKEVVAMNPGAMRSKGNRTAQGKSPPDLSTSIEFKLQEPDPNLWLSSWLPLKPKNGFLNKPQGPEAPGSWDPNLCPRNFLERSCEVRPGGGLFGGYHHYFGVG